MINTEHKQGIPGKRLKHYFTGLEIKLLVQTAQGWRAQVIGNGCQDYIVNLTDDEVNKRFVDVLTE